MILELSANAGEVKSVVEAAVDGFAKRGFRSLGQRGRTPAASGGF